MKCPFCGDADTQVIDPRVNDEGDSIRRRRKCSACDKRFTTFETADLQLPQVVKTNGTREEFSRDKLRLSFTRALHKRPVPTEYVDRALDHIVKKMLAQKYEPVNQTSPNLSNDDLLNHDDTCRCRDQTLPLARASAATPGR